MEGDKEDAPASGKETMRRNNHGNRNDGATTQRVRRKRSPVGNHHHQHNNNNNNTVKRAHRIALRQDEADARVKRRTVTRSPRLRRDKLKPPPKKDGPREDDVDDANQNDDNHDNHSSFASPQVGAIRVSGSTELAVAADHPTTATTNDDDDDDDNNDDNNNNHNTEPPLTRGIAVSNEELAQEYRNQVLRDVPYASCELVVPRTPVPIKRRLVVFLGAFVVFVLVLVLGVGGAVFGMMPGTSAAAGTRNGTSHAAVLELLQQQMYDPAELGNPRGIYARAYDRVVNDPAIPRQDSPQHLVHRIFLTAFFELTGGGGGEGHDPLFGWTNQDNWNTSASLCDWHGITCDNNQDLDYLELSDNNLQGSLLPELSKLGWTRVDLSNNQLSGSIPQYFEHFLDHDDEVSFMDLSANQLTGTLPLCVEGAAADGFLWRVDCSAVACDCCTPSCDVDTVAQELYARASQRLVDASVLDDPNSIYAQVFHRIVQDRTIPGYGLDLFNRLVLTVLFELTDGAEWTVRTHWNTSVSLCEWYGVTCLSDLRDEDSNGREQPRHIDLRDNNLHGPLVPELGRLGWTHLDLSDNALTGSIPQCFEEIGSSFSSLDLSGNEDLFGRVPMCGNDDRVVIDGTIAVDCDRVECSCCTPSCDESSNPSNSASLSDELVMDLHFRASRNMYDPSQLDDPNSIYARVFQRIIHDPTISSTGNQLYLRFMFTVLFEITHGDQWIHNDNWNTSVSYCEWYGITCARELRDDGDAQESRLVYLDLSGNHLRGPLLPELGPMGWQRVDLSDNALTGSIPQHFARFNDQVAIDLSGNEELVGSIIPLCEENSDRDIRVDCDNVECSCCTPSCD